MYSYATLCVCASGHAREYVACDGYLRHKTFLVTPSWLMSHQVDVYAALQQPGNCVIVKPRVMHWGMNLGRNMAEAANFALASHAEEIPAVDGYRFLVCLSSLRFVD